jgi:exopolysaccharide biosynthesis polyprenyl glycosylphosphotransferase
MNRTRVLLILLSDLAAYYLSLFFTLVFKYGSGYGQMILKHFWLFSCLLIFWVFASYILDLWKSKTFKNQTIIFLRLFGAVSGFLFLSMAFIYLFGDLFGISPRRNLIIFCAIFFLVSYIFRSILKNIFSRSFKTNVLLVGNSIITQEIVSTLLANPHMGYVAREIPETLDFDDLKNIVLGQKGDNLIVFNDASLCKKEESELAYKYIFLKNTEIMNLTDFYEMIFIKEPVEILDENWFVRNIKSKQFYDFSKRLFDIFVSIILMIVLFPIALVIGILVKLNDNGPIFFNQERMGKAGKSFVLHKFRSMVVNNGPVWTTANDDRITPIGKFIRASHLDEIPQLINIFKGDISFVGPRPEQTKIIADLRDKIPYYDVRHIVKPGLTGWAQIHYKASASIDETKEKLKYDFYYIKNSSSLLDLLVLIKTVKLFFINPK